MPLFFLHIRGSGRLIFDNVGSEFADLQLAREEAERLVHELLDERLWLKTDADNDIEICDPAGQRLELVTMTRVVTMPTSLSVH